jgi:hypothetical protein
MDAAPHGRRRPTRREVRDLLASGVRQRFRTADAARDRLAADVAAGRTRRAGGTDRAHVRHLKKRADREDLTALGVTSGSARRNDGIPYAA